MSVSGWSALFAAASAALGGGAPTGVAPGHGYVWPLLPQPAVVREFEPPPQPWSSGHRGADLLGSPGQTVRAAGAGRVAFSGVIAGRGVVSVEHANGWRTTYEPVQARVTVGTTVASGATVGTLGPTAASHCAPRACLHWGLLTAPKEYRDPLVLLRSRHPVLLPLG